MSISVQPPDYQFNGLFYNPDFWTSSTSTLTQDVANELYLQKTTPDFASALETFNGGINTNNIRPTAPTTSLLIADNITSGELFLGVNSTATTARTQHIHIGDSNNLPAGAGVHINNGNNNDSNTNINNGATSTGNVNIMTGNTSNGNVNIKTGTGSGNINFGSTSGTQTIQINRPLTLGYAPSAFSANTQLGYNISTGAATTFSIGAGATGTLKSITVPAGVWIIQGTVAMTITGQTYGYFSVCITTGTTINYAYCSATAVTNDVMSFQPLRIHTGAGATYNLVARSQFALSLGDIKLDAFRIG